ncbi:MAG: hypothetical protein JEZ07_12465 [Phycisphaerae bacterium]|nr:hypothetical protein [Phycisphaerae bacterium]
MHNYDVWKWQGNSLVSHSFGQINYPSYVSETSPVAVWFQNCIVTGQCVSNCTDAKAKIMILDSTTGKLKKEIVVPQGWHSYSNKGFKTSANGKFVVGLYEEDAAQNRDSNNAPEKPGLKLSIIGPDIDDFRWVGPVANRRNWGVLTDYAISNDGAYTAIAGWWDNETIVVDNYTGKLLWHIRPTDGTVNGMVFSHDGNKLYLFESRGGLFVIDTVTGHNLRKLWSGNYPRDFHNWQASAMAVSPNSKYLAMAIYSHDDMMGFVYLLNLNNNKLVKIINYEDAYYMERSCVDALLFSPDSTKLATSKSMGTIKIWNCDD